MKKKKLFENLPNRTPLMKCIDYSRAEGYTADFFVKDQHLHTQSGDEKCKPEDVLIVNFCRFEGMSNPSDNVILFLLKTKDGVKGTMTEAYGVYADQETSDFMRKVEDLHDPSWNNRPQSVPELDN